MRVVAREAYPTPGYILHRVNESLTDHSLINEHYLALDIIAREAKSIDFTFLFSHELDGDYDIAVVVNN
ncbi:unnamed protein product [Rotaria sordida]|uniref:Uncharacterized protein n=2 Tax=Rotaria sordida TaxID=392033 RepID=A0A815LTB0_9BILA|nr:unnamed protein product [Rotaria sordida]CAF1414874.1 unnamed protein product [Rotaria sordida]